jgi:hypothetical protein
MLLYSGSRKAAKNDNLNNKKNLWRLCVRHKAFVHAYQPRILVDSSFFLNSFYLASRDTSDPLSPRTISEVILR